MAQTPRRTGNSRNPNYNQPPMQNQPGMTQNGVPGNGAYYTQNQTGNQQGQRLTPQQKKARLRRKQEMIRRRRRHRRLLFAAAFLLIVGIAFFLIRFLNGSSSAPTDAGLDEVDTAVDDEDEEEKNYTGPAITTIAFVGDISTSADQVQAVTKSDGTYDFNQPLQNVASYISGADFAVGDFETNMVDGLAYGGEPYYNSPIQLAGSLRSIGFRLMSTANTYMLNNGIDGLTSTKNYLEEAKLKSVGTYLSQEDRDKNGGAYIRTIHKIKFAFLAYTKGTDSVMMPAGCEYALNTLYSDYSDYWTKLNSNQIRQDVQAAKDAGADVIVALVHWGSEYGRSISEPQQEAADLLMKNGVDVIIGTHSHLVGSMGFEKVTQTDGSTKNCFIAYSLGDFYTDPTDEAAQSSVILNITFEKADNGNVTMSASYVPIYQNITTDENGKKSFELLDVYQSIAEIKQQDEITSAQAKLYNTLLDVLDTLHNYAGEELDAGPDASISRMVQNALNDGAYTAQEIKELKKKEQDAAKEAAAAEAAAQEAAGETTDETEPPTEESPAE